jgi:hypothetical protein
MAMTHPTASRNRGGDDLRLGERVARGRDSVRSVVSCGRHKDVPVSCRRQSSHRSSDVLLVR